MWRTRSLIWLPVLAVAFMACSFSDSSQSISDSIGGSSKSSSSSSPGDKEAAYQNDIRDYTSAYVRSGGQVDMFWRDVGSIAQKHGITNWEAAKGTYLGIGEGLAKANVNSTELMVYKQNLTGYDATKMQEIQEGYNKLAKN